MENVVVLVVNMVIVVVATGTVGIVNPILVPTVGTMNDDVAGVTEVVIVGTVVIVDGIVFVGTVGTVGIVVAIVKGTVVLVVVVATTVIDGGTPGNVQFATDSHSHLFVFGLK